MDDKDFRSILSGLKDVRDYFNAIGYEAGSDYVVRWYAKDINVSTTVVLNRQVYSLHTAKLKTKSNLSVIAVYRRVGLV